MRLTYFALYNTPRPCLGTAQISVPGSQHGSLSPTHFPLAPAAAPLLHPSDTSTPTKRHPTKTLTLHPLLLLHRRIKVIRKRVARLVPQALILLVRFTAAGLGRSRTLLVLLLLSVSIRTRRRRRRARRSSGHRTPTRGVARRVARVALLILRVGRVVVEIVVGKVRQTVIVSIPRRYWNNRYYDVEGCKDTGQRLRVGCKPSLSLPYG